MVQADSPDCEYAIPELEQDTVRVHSNFNNARLYGDRIVSAVWIHSQPRRRCWDDSTTGTTCARQRRVAFLGSDAAKQLFPGRNPVGETVYLNDFPYTVDRRDGEEEAGFQLRRLGREQSLPSVCRDAARFSGQASGNVDTFDQLLVTPKSVEQHEACKREVRTALARMHHYDPNDKEACPIWDTVQEAQAFKTMTDGMKFFLGAVGIVTLFLGGIGVMNVMLVAVRERTREIGVRKAIGAPARTILRQFFIEALIIALLSGGIGLGVAFGFCALVNMLPMPDFFAGLIPSWSSGLMAAGLLGSDRGGGGALSGAEGGVDRSD